MALRNGTVGNLILSEFSGALVALRFIGMTDRPVKTVPDKKTKTVVEQVVPRADLLVFSSQGDEIRAAGITLVFQQGIGAAVLESAGDWVVGILSQQAQQSDETRTFYVLESVADDTLTRMGAAMTAAGHRL